MRPFFSFVFCFVSFYQLCNRRIARYVPRKENCKRNRPASISHTPACAAMQQLIRFCAAPVRAFRWRRTQFLTKLYRQSFYC